MKTINDHLAVVYIADDENVTLAVGDMILTEK